MQSPDFHFDGGQDAELRAVAVPSGLRARLRGIPLRDDEGLDEAVRDVPVPAGLVERLQFSAVTTEDGLRSAIREVPVPADLLSRLRHVPKNRVRLARLAHWGTAVSLLLAIGLSYAGVMIAFLLATYPSIEAAGPELITSWTGALGDGSDTQVDLLAGPVLPESRQSDEGGSGGLGMPLSPVRLAEFRGSSRSPLAELIDLFSRERIEADGGAWRAVPVVRWGDQTPLGHDPYDELPELKKVAGLRACGIDPPLIPWFPWREYRWYGIYPFVSPAHHPQLRNSVVPLGVDASSYELTRRYLEDGELPPAEDVRTEDFLAAVDYEFPRPENEALELAMAMGPSPFGGEGMYLLQVGVQSRPFQDRERPPAYLVLAVDVSASMRWGGRLETVRRAIGSLAGLLGPEDRLSVVAFSEQAELLAEDIGGDDAEDLRAAAALLSARSSTNLAAGLRWAYAVARRRVALGESPTRVVLLTDGQADLAPRGAELLEQRLAEAVQREILLEVLDLGQEKEPNEQLAGFGRAGSGRVRRAGNADQVRWALQEIITGRSPLVARGALLKVKFHPKTVLAYRLFGHEADSMAGLVPARPQADFYTDQSATALYEVLLKPDGHDSDEVAAVELSWQEPGPPPGERHKVTRKIRRGQFGYSFLEAPLCLQEAALVAETAEILRRSPFAPLPRNSRSMAMMRVLELARQVDTRLHQRPTFVEFISVVDRATKAGPYRRGTEK